MSKNPVHEIKKPDQVSRLVNNNLLDRQNHRVKSDPMDYRENSSGSGSNQNNTRNPNNGPNNTNSLTNINKPPTNDISNSTNNMDTNASANQRRNDEVILVLDFSHVSMHGLDLDNNYFVLTFQEGPRVKTVSLPLSKFSRLLNMTQNGKSRPLYEIKFPLKRGNWSLTGAYLVENNGMPNGNQKFKPGNGGNTFSTGDYENVVSSGMIVVSPEVLRNHPDPKRPDLSSGNKTVLLTGSVQSGLFPLIVGDWNPAADFVCLNANSNPWNGCMISETSTEKSMQMPSNLYAITLKPVIRSGGSTGYFSYFELTHMASSKEMKDSFLLMDSVDPATLTQPSSNSFQNWVVYVLIALVIILLIAVICMRCRR